MHDTEAPNVFMDRPQLEKLPSLLVLPGGFTLRQLTVHNAEALAQLLALTFEEPWDSVRACRDLLQASDVKAVYGVFHQDDLVATASSQVRPLMTTQAGFVHWVGTHPEYQQRGLASILLHRVLEDFTARGYTQAHLVTQPHRLAAIRTYLKFGFIPRYEVDGTDQTILWSTVFQRLFDR